MSAFKILENGISKTTILQTEGKCPNCGNEKTEYFQEDNVKYGKYRGKRFHYLCRRCSSKWIGEIYSSDFEECLSQPM